MSVAERRRSTVAGAAGAGAGAAPMSAGELRSALRRGRRRHRPGSTGEFLTDLYMAALLLAMYGWAAADTIAGYTAAEHHAPAAVSIRGWLTVAALVVLGGVGWNALAALGPLFATPAAQTWALSTPISRRGWLLPRLMAVAGVAADAGAAVGAAAAAVAVAADVWWAVAAGALAAVAMTAVATVAQARVRVAARVRRFGTGAIMVGVAGCGAVVAARAADLAVPRPGLMLAPVAAVAAVGCVATLVLAVRALARVDRAALTGGAQVAAAAANAATLLDPTLLVDVLAVRRWRRIGRVKSVRWLPGSRWWVLLQVELRRPLRRPSAPIAWAALLLAPYVVNLVAPSVVGPVRIIACYLAVDRLAGGLRTVLRSAPLRRAIGGDEMELRVVHLIVPAIGMCLWMAATAPVDVIANPTVMGLVAVGVLAAVYRAAGRRPVSYSGMAVDTPFGLLPLDLIRQVFRGPDILAVVLLIHALGGG